MDSDPLSDGKSLLELVSVHASDLGVVNAAKVSFAKQTKEMGTSEQAILRFLMKNRHGSPFEHNFFQFRVRAPIFVTREWQKHRVGISQNELSGRYVEIPKVFYTPSYIRTQIGKPGSYTFLSIDNPSHEQMAEDYIRENNSQCWERYLKLLRLGVAKEQARIVLPLNIYTEFFWSCNARSLMNFISLRIKEDAMWEIAQYARDFMDLLALQMPITAQAFEASNYTSP